MHDFRNTTKINDETFDLVFESVYGILLNMKKFEYHTGSLVPKVPKNAHMRIIIRLKEELGSIFIFNLNEAKRIR